jgi:argininosuccinate lyase
MRLNSNNCCVSCLSIGCVVPLNAAAPNGEISIRFILSTNSLDAVSDRDYIIETLHNISLTMIHLSRFAEEIIFWPVEKASDRVMNFASSVDQKIISSAKRDK